MRELRASTGETLLVDDADYEDLARYSWRRIAKGYFARTGSIDGVRFNEYIHRRIMKLSPVNADPRFVDHKNRDKTDNRRNNLRFCTRAQNNANSKKPRNNKSGFKGVFQSKTGSWEAHLRRPGRSSYIGRYPTPEEAQQAYYNEARKFHGEFASKG